MEVLSSGYIGETVRARIAAAKQKVRGTIRGAAGDTRSFSQVLRSMTPAVNTAEEKKAYPDGKTLIYALSNADTDQTASALLRGLGIVSGKDSGINDADRLMSSLNLLNTVRNGDDETVKVQLSEFADRFNAMLSYLDAQGTSSGYMYAQLLRTAAENASESLSRAGVAVSEDGKLTFDAQKYETLDADSFLSSVSAAVSSVSTYASTVRNSTGLLDFLTEDEESSAADYMTSLMNLYM